MKLASCLYFVFVVLCFQIASSKKSLPSYVTVCHRNDPNLNACCRKAVELIRPHLREGIPELQIPPLSPLVLPEAGLDNGDSFRASFKNIQIYHADEFKLDYLNVDLDKLHVELGLSFSKLRILSEYNINGRILILQLRGHGPADGNFTDVSARTVIDGSRYMKKGKEYVDFQNVKLDLKLGKPVFRFDHIFGDNEELNEQTNKIVNENIESIIEELRPVIDKTVTEFTLGVVRRVFTRFSFDELFPK